MKSSSRVANVTRDRLTDERGATAVEYALISSLIAGVIALTVGGLGVIVLGLFDSVSF